MKKIKIFWWGIIDATLISEGSLDTWYIATCEGKNDEGSYKMDHLMRVRDGNNLK